MDILQIPIQLLTRMRGSRVTIRTRYNTKISGILKMHDQHMNILLGQVVQLRDGKKMQYEGLFVRGDGIIAIGQIQ